MQCAVCNVRMGTCYVRIVLFDTDVAGGTLCKRSSEPESGVPRNGIYLVYTWYIPGIDQCLRYRRYIPGIYQVYTW